MKKTALLDLGNTLVWYYSYEETHQVLAEAITGVKSWLAAGDLLHVTDEQIEQGLVEDSRTSGGLQFRSMEARLTRVFQLDGLGEPVSQDTLHEMCMNFMQPVLRRASLFTDVHPFLEKLRSEGWQLAIVSNSPWGCPGDIWRAEIARHGLLERVDEAILCSDAGFRKPDPAIFEYTLRRLNVKADECVFAGDDPRWDIAGPQAVGIQAILVDRKNTGVPAPAPRVRNLQELGNWLETWEQIRYGATG